MSSMLDLLPNDIGLRVELDTNEAYYLQSGWVSRWDGIYGFACGYSGLSDVTWFEEPARIAIMHSHVKLVTPCEHATKTHNRSEGTE